MVITSMLSQNSAKKNIPLCNYRTGIITLHIYFSVFSLATYADSLLVQTNALIFPPSLTFFFSSMYDMLSYHTCH